MAPKEIEEDEKPVKIDKWDGSAVKNALDDAVLKVFNKKLNYSENHMLMDIRLVICTIAVGVAMFALAWDYFYPFPLSRPLLIICVSSYFVMMGILTLYTTYAEKRIFAVHVQTNGAKKGSIWESSSNLKKYDDKYYLTINFFDGGKRGPKTKATSKKSVANYIDTEGTVVYELVETEVIRLHNQILSEKKDK